MYGFTVRVRGTFAEAVNRVTHALRAEGFTILSEIDVAATLKAETGVEHLPYKILGACNPELVRGALEIEPDIGLLLPCNVIVRALENGDNVVGFADPRSVLGLVSREEIRAVGEKAWARLRRARDALTR